MTIARYLGSGTAATVLGGAQALGRLKIFHQTSKGSDYVGEISALFNPNRLAFSGQVPFESRVNTAAGPDATNIELTGFNYQPTTLQISLFFDTSEATQGPAQTGDDRRNVLAHTSRIVALLRPLPGGNHPPRCLLRWGRYQILKGVLTSLSQEFTRFLPDGTPVRATLQCTFTQDDSDPRQQDSAGPSGRPRLYLVNRGDTLQSIAAVQYGKPDRWRDIALANNITNPRRLIPHRILKLPP